MKIKKLSIRGELFHIPPKERPSRPDLRKVKNIDVDEDLQRDLKTDVSPEKS